MISLRLILTSLFVGGIALFLFDLLWYFLEKKLALLKRVPSEILDEMGPGFFFSRFVMQFAFLVVLPTVTYSWFYLLIPFYGVRAGIGTAIFLFSLGIVPFSVTLLMRIKLPLAFTLFQMAGFLLKLILIYGIIAYLYVL